MYLGRISHSKRDCYRECGWKYLMRYDEKLDGDKTQDHLQFGSYIHKIFEVGVSATTFDELDKIGASLRENYEFSEEYARKTKTCIRNFLRLNSSLQHTISTEFQFEVDLGNDLIFNGVIDRIMKSPDNKFLVIDYKTGKTEKNKTDLFNDLQMQGYAFAIHKLYNVPYSDITVAHYYPLTDKLVSIRYLPWQIANFEKSLMRDCWDIRKAKKTELKPRQNKFCNWCDYQKVCPIFTSIEVVKQRIEEARMLKKSNAAEEREEETPDDPIKTDENV